MIQSIALILFLSAIGDAVANWSNLPVPGAAIGLLTLSVIFVLRGAPDKWMVRLFDTVSPVFPLFFVPAAAGTVANVDLFAQAWLHVLAAIVLSTIVTISVTGLVAQALIHLIGHVRAA